MSFLADQLKTKLLRGELSFDHNLAMHTSWRIGGPAKCFYQPADLADLAAFLRVLPSSEKVVWLGGGSNVLIADAGIDAVVICIRNRLNVLQQLDEFTIRVESGVGCARLVQHCVKCGMTDAVFLSGIPGTVGGALAMNAGAYGDDIWKHVIAVETINRAGEIKLKKAAEFTAVYRKVTGLVEQEWFVAGHLSFARQDPVEAERLMRELLQKRKATQPLDAFTCGSVFKNPPNDYAARLIELCGFKGKQIGGAKVSEKHANFIVNAGNATAADITALIDEITAKVAQNCGVTLETEVHCLGNQ